MAWCHDSGRAPKRQSCLVAHVAGELGVETSLAHPVQLLARSYHLPQALTARLRAGLLACKPSAATIGGQDLGAAREALKVSGQRCTPSYFGELWKNQNLGFSTMWAKCSTM